MIASWQDRLLGRFRVCARGVEYLREAGPAWSSADGTRPAPAADGAEAEPFGWGQVHEALDKIQRLVRSDR